MVKNLKAMLAFCVVVSLFVSCTKDIQPVIPTEPGNVETTIPDNNTSSPVENPETPSENPETPSEEPGTPNEEPETPSEKPGTPTEKPETPTEKPETPTEKPETPTEKPETPTEKPGTPTEKPETPTEKPGTPTEKPGTPTEKPGTNNPGESLPGQNPNSIEVGIGSGDLTIDGNDAKIKGKSLIIIKAGTYGTVTIKNISAPINNPVFIKNGGLVAIKSVMKTDNLSNVTIAGDNISSIKYGFIFHDISYRAVVMTGKTHGLSLKNLSFKNVRDYVILNGSNLPYQGSAETRIERFKILDCKFDNVGGIQFSGNLGNGTDSGFLKDLEIANNIIINSNWGNFAYFSNVQDYNIHHNIIDNLNPQNNNHNGIFHMIGNGKFHNNKLTNYQGNAIRAWAFSRGTSPSTIEIYNNIAYNTRKYGAFEIQGFDKYLVSGKTTVANAKVYNNTVGKMNTSKSFEGVILDLYNYGGTLEYYNNLGFDLNQSKPITDMINNMSSTKIIKNTNNKYVVSASEAVSSVTNFVSKHSGIGSNL